MSLEETQKLINEVIELQRQINILKKTICRNHRAATRFTTKSSINNYENANYNLTPEPYPHWTIKEIYEQPEMCLKSLNMGGRILDNCKVKLMLLGNIPNLL